MISCTMFPRFPSSSAPPVVQHDPRDGRGSGHAPVPVGRRLRQRMGRYRRQSRVSRARLRARRGRLLLGAGTLALSVRLYSEYLLLLFNSRLFHLFIISLFSCRPMSQI